MLTRGTAQVGACTELAETYPTCTHILWRPQADCYWQPMCMCLMMTLHTPGERGIVR